MTEVVRKAYPVELKTFDDAPGKVEALVSVFNNVDLGGDRVMPGAFSKSIEKWKASGNPVPVIWSHDWGNLWSHIGAVQSLEETEQGLKAEYTLDIDDNPAAAQAYRLMKRGTLKEHSFAYTVAKAKRQKDAVDLMELDLIEVGPTLKGMNPETEVLAVKSALEQVTAEHGKAAPPDDVDTKAGRTLSKANESKLRSAMEAIGQVLSSLGSGEVETEKAADDDQAKDVTPDSGDVDGKSADLELLSFKQRIEELDL